MRIKFLLAVLLSFVAYNSAMGQSATETLKYINDIVNSEAAAVTKFQGQKYVWRVAPDGLLTIKLFHRDGYVLDTKTFYLKTLCNDISCTTIESMPDYGSNRPPIIILSMTSKSGKQLRLSMGDDESANRIKNAIFHLVTLAKTNKAYKGKDPFDY